VPRDALIRVAGFLALDPEGHSGTSASLRNGCGRPRLAPTPPLGRPRFTTHKRVPSGEPITKCATCCPLCGGT
jgi:hypothetical protein